MIYSIKYNKHSAIIKEAQEIRIKLNINDLSIFTTFIPEHINQRIVICIDDLEECINNKYIKKISNIVEEKYPKANVAIRLSEYEEELLPQLKECKIDFFFNKFINNWEELHKYINLGVSDLYIVEDLCFELDKVKNLVNNIKIRTFPNVSQKKVIETSPIKTFFIRPEDVNTYSKYVDILEFFGDGKKDEIYYKIYNNDKKWYGDLQELIIDLGEEVDSRFIIPKFAEKRIKCGRKCLKGDNCKICDRILELSQNLKESKLIVRVDKEEKDNG